MKKKKFPIKAIHNNLVKVDKEKVFAYYHVPSEFVTRVDFTKKKKIKNNITHILDELSIYGALDIRLLPRDMTLEERFNDLLQTMPEYSYDAVEYYLERLHNELQEEMGQVYVYDWLIGVPLSNVLANGHVAGALKENSKQFLGSLADLFGYQVDTSDWVDVYSELEEEVYQKLALLKATRIPQEEMYYLTRLNFIRNMPHSMKTEQVNQTIKQAIDGVLDFSKMGQVHLGNYTGDSYIAFLPLAQTKDVLNDINIGEVIQYFGFPIECQFQVFYEQNTSLLNNGLKNKVARSKRRLDSINQEQFEATGDLSSQKVKTSDVLKQMEDDIERGEKFVGWTATLVVYGQTEEELKKRIDIVLSFFNREKVSFVRGTTEQYDLFIRGLLGQLEKEKSYWYHLSTTAGFSENLLFVNNRVGTRTGFYMGRVDTGLSKARNLKESIFNSKNIVLFNPTIINKGLEQSLTDSPHIVVTGETGKGKSYLINLIHFYMSFFTKSIYVDVKNEKKERYLAVINDENVQRDYPLLVKHIKENFTFVELDADNADFKGVLDPLIFMDGVESTTLAQTIFKEVYDFKGKDRQERMMNTYINEVAQLRQQGVKVGLMSVVDMLINDSHEAVRECGLLIKEKVNASILRLLFGDENSQSLDFDTKHTILGFKGLDLPKATESATEYKDNQRFSILIMYALGYFSKIFGSNRHDFTVFYIDEAWLYFMTHIGKAIMQEMKRIGRSFNNALVLGTQSVKDFGNADDKGNFGTFFAFDEPTERPEILKHLRLPVTPENEQYLENLIKGQCLYLDNYGRCQKISVHCPYEEVDRLFKTVDKTSMSEMEHKYI